MNKHAQNMFDRLNDDESYKNMMKSLDEPTRKAIENAIGGFINEAGKGLFELEKIIKNQEVKELMLKKVQSKGNRD